MIYLSESEIYYYCTRLLLIISAIAVFIKIFVRLTVGICRSHVNLQGKTAIITGGNAGLGYTVSLALAARGARIIIADVNDATQTIKKIICETNNENVSYKYLNLASFTSIRTFAKEINAEEEHLDVLINNAGVSGFNEIKTEDGFQYSTQVNHLGPFLLTHLLSDKMKKSAPSRIIFVSSLLAFINCLTVDNMHRAPNISAGLVRDALSYGNSKLVNIIIANIFAEKLRKYGVTCNAVHPGLINTDIFRRYGGKEMNGVLYYLFEHVILINFGKSLWEGIQTQLNCAISTDLEKVTGKYFVDCIKFTPPPKAWNKKFCADIWEKCEYFVQLREKEKLL